MRGMGALGGGSGRERRRGLSGLWSIVSLRFRVMTLGIYKKEGPGLAGIGLV